MKTESNYLSDVDVDHIDTRHALDSKQTHPFSVSGGTAQRTFYIELILSAHREAHPRNLNAFMRAYG